MESQELIAAINMALTEMEEQPEDLHEVHLRLLELLNQLRATGANLPSDLVELEKQMAEHVEGVKPKT